MGGKKKPKTSDGDAPEAQPAPAVPAEPPPIPVDQPAAPLPVPEPAEEVEAEPKATRDAETLSKRAFTGRSGHLAVMAEFLYRLINVAIPEVDVGDDVFVVKGDSAEVVRVQVKTATAIEQVKSYVALVNVPESQLQVPQDNPPLVYAFPVRRKKGKEGRWSDFIVIRRETLFVLYDKRQAGTRYVDKDSKKPYVQFRIVLTDATAQSGPGKVDMQPYRDAWDPWPPPRYVEEEPGEAAPGAPADGA